MMPSIEEALARIVSYADARATHEPRWTGDALLDQLSVDTDHVERLHYRRRLLFEYARHLARPGPLLWSNLAAATHLSDARVKHTYTDEDLAAIVALLSPKDTPCTPS